MSQIDLTEISQMFVTTSTKIGIFQKAGMYHLHNEKFSVSSMINEAISDNFNLFFFCIEQRFSAPLRYDFEPE